MAGYLITLGFEFSFLRPVLLKFIFEPKGYILWANLYLSEWWMGVVWVGLRQNLNNDHCQVCNITPSIQKAQPKLILSVSYIGFLNV